MLLANIGWDLQSYSGGRFILGLGQPDQAAHHQALLDGVEPSGTAHAGDDPRGTGDLGHVVERDAARVPRRVLPAHADDPVLHADRDRPRPSSVLPKIFLAGVGELMTEVAGEVCDGFICHGFTTEQVPARGDAAGARARTRQGRQDDGGLRDRRSVVRRHRQRRGRDRQGSRRHAAADRLLRIDAGLPRRARDPRLGRPPGRAQRALEAGQVGRDGQPDRRRGAQHVRRRRRTGRRSPPSSASATATSSAASRSTPRTPAIPSGGAR